MSESQTSAAQSARLDPCRPSVAACPAAYLVARPFAAAYRLVAAAYRPSAAAYPFRPSASRRKSESAA
eukprot:scaffold70170_cov36-Phaeocystis_antarctica.AAC.2